MSSIERYLKVFLEQDAAEVGIEISEARQSSLDWSVDAEPQDRWLNESLQEHLHEFFGLALQKMYDRSEEKEKKLDERKDDEHSR